MTSAAVKAALRQVEDRHRRVSRSGSAVTVVTDHCHPDRTTSRLLLANPLASRASRDKPISVCAGKSGGQGQGRTADLPLFRPDVPPSRHATCERSWALPPADACRWLLLLLSPLLSCATASDGSYPSSEALARTAISCPRQLPRDRPPAPAQVIPAVISVSTSPLALRKRHVLAQKSAG